MQPLAAPYPVAMIIPLFAAAIVAPAPAGDFDRLATLVGHWQGRTDGGRAVDIRYTLISNGSALVEEWVSPRGAKTMTVYYRDGAAVLATHFCAQGNQPRLALVPTAGPRLRFALRDATNLTPGASHQHDFWIELTPDGSMRRAETYRTGGADETETMTLRRVA